MTGLAAIDRYGRMWELLAIEGVICALLVAGTSAPTVMSVPDLIDLHGPIRLSPDRCRLSPGAHAALVDVVDLVASDPETATVEQIREVATTAAHLLLGARPAPPSA